MRWLAALALCSCSVIYDTGELEICSEPPEFPEPVCADSVLMCLRACGVDEDCTFCYDANGNGEFEQPEIDCFQCGVFKFYECVAENGCSRETELAFCCSEALCGPAGCPEMDNPCELEFTALNECILALPDPTICNSSGTSCFGS